MGLTAAEEPELRHLLVRGAPPWLVLLTPERGACRHRGGAHEGAVAVEVGWAWVLSALLQAEWISFLSLFLILPPLSFSALPRGRHFALLSAPAPGDSLLAC